MLSIGGGRERMAWLLVQPEFLRVYPVPAAPAERAALIERWHRRKSEIFQRILEEGAIPARSGVRRLVQEALARKWRLGVASTSARASVEAVLRLAVGAEAAARFEFVLGGESVARKKPAPDVYLRAAQLFGVLPDGCVVIEDSHLGLRAAKDAGCVCVVTPSAPTLQEDFSAADLVVSALGDPDGEACRLLATRRGVTPGRCLTIDDLAALRLRR